MKAETGNPVLLNAATEAMKRWKFTPFTDGSGKAVKATTELKFSFHM